MLEDKYSLAPFEKWSTVVIHRHPAKGRTVVNPANYRKEHLRRFDHPPTRADINRSIMNWNIYVKRDGKTVRSAGISEKLWRATTGEEVLPEDYEMLFGIK